MAQRPPQALAQKDPFLNPKTVPVVTNAFAIQTLPTTRGRVFYHYDTFLPEIKQPFRAQMYLDHLQTVQEPQIFRPRVVFDGKKNVWSSHLLFEGPGATFEVKASKNPTSKAKPILIRFNLVGEPIDVLSAINSLVENKAHPRQAEAVNVLQATVRQFPIMQEQTFNARSVFTNQGSRPIGGGFELWRGFFQSVRPAPGRMIINVDTSTGMVYSPQRLDAWAVEFLYYGEQRKNIRTLAHMSPQSVEFKKLKQALKNLKFRPVVPQKSQGVRPIKSIILEAGKFEFDYDGRMVTVAQYYYEKYGKQLQYPELFGVVTKEKPFKVVFPAEICMIEPGQLYKKAAPPHLMNEILKFSSQSPADRLRAIQRGVQGNFLGYSSSDFMSTASVMVNPTPITTKGKMLHPPFIQYGSNTIKPKDGAWNLLGQRFAKPGDLTQWVIVNFTAKVHWDLVLRFIDTLIDCCHKLGMRTSRPINTVNISFSGQGLTDRALKEIVDYKPKLVVAVLPNEAAEIRRDLKVWGDTIYGIPTQCVRENKIYKANNQYCNNLAMKINTKMHGTNSIVQHPLKQTGLLSTPTMIVGIDVGHAGAGINNQPSIASLVASYDPDFAKYMTLISLQKPRSEIIVDLKAMIMKAMQFFYHATKVFKFRIVVFRDGVSEGEYDKVMVQEVAAIEEAWSEFTKPLLKEKESLPPRLSYIVVGKRHHIRFFPAEGMSRDDFVDRSTNFTAGLVVDKEITDPRVSQNFYLQSHGGIKGTSRSGHYIILRDDNKFPTDLWEHVAFYLCHVYSRASRSVSIPAPVYYADIVCARAVFYFKNEVTYGTELSSESPDECDLDWWRARFRPVHRNLRGGMFFV